MDSLVLTFEEWPTTNGREEKVVEQSQDFFTPITPLQACQNHTRTRTHNLFETAMHHFFFQYIFISLQFFFFVGMFNRVLNVPIIKFFL